MDPHQPALDARVADAAEAWLNDPRDLSAYERLVAAVEHRRRSLDAADSAPGGHQHPVVGSQGADAPHQSAVSTDATVPADSADAADPEHVDSWPAVRAVGADLVGDPIAVLRRLRGG